MRYPILFNGNKKLPWWQVIIKPGRHHGLEHFRPINHGSARAERMADCAKLNREDVAG